LCQHRALTKTEEAAQSRSAMNDFSLQGSAVPLQHRVAPARIAGGKTLSRSAARALLVGALLGIASAHGASPVDVLVNPAPQTDLNSCQVYGLAFAAASVPGSPLQARNAKELRVLEQELRKRRDQLAANTGKDKLDHTLWETVIAQASNGVLVAKATYIPSMEDFHAQVEKESGIAKASTLGPVLAGAVSKGVVLTSVTKVGSSSYAGHIVGVMGLDRGTQSPVPLLMLNPAVKVGPSPLRNVCDLDGGLGDEKYQATATIEKKYVLKKFGAGYMFMTVRKK
jgi:hypothetical protein